MRIAICGCGALGSQIAMLLALPGREFVLIDDDVVEDVNLGTTVYFTFHVGVPKVVALAELLYRRAECQALPVPETLERKQRILRIAPDLVVDTFDNADARALTHNLFIPTVHAGVSEERAGAVLWDLGYKVPQGLPRGENPVCTHELGRPILRTVALCAVNVIERFLADGARLNCFLRDETHILFTSA